MDVSSSLAALQQSPLLRNSQFPFSHKEFRFPRVQAASSATMSLREQLQRANGGDYISLKEVRGSSPAATLAADMSVNFGLDNGNSPRFPTPRRTLFGAGGRNNKYTATQQALTSSPRFSSNDIESSPSLPSNTPSRSLASPPISIDTMIMASPSPNFNQDDSDLEIDMESDEDFDDDEDSMMVDSPLQMVSRQPAFSAMVSSRKEPRSIPHCGPMSRAKGYSFHRGTDSHPLFCCGPVSSSSSIASAHSSTTSLASGSDGRLSRMSSHSFLDEEEISFDSSFAVSEADDPLPSFLSHRPPSAGAASVSSSTASTVTAISAPLISAPPLFRSRSSMQSLNNDRISTRNSGSPIGHIRRPSNPFSRSRKQFRRTLSMFGSAEEIMRPRALEPGPAIVPPNSAVGLSAGIKLPSPVSGTALTAALKVVMDNVVEDASVSSEPKLPHYLPDDPTDSIPRITKETMLDILDGKYSEMYDSKMVIDCRFEYEYEGGHIDGAVNHNNKDLLTKQLFDTPIAGRSLLIFHCEYSAHRAPLMARHVRARDRDINRENYPRLTYPEVYILEGGYCKFFEEHPTRCYPQNYIEMMDKAHERTCERELDRLKNRKAPAFSRAKTFAYGAGFSAANRHCAVTTQESPQPRSITGAHNLCRSPVAFVTPRRLASF